MFENVGNSNTSPDRPEMIRKTRVFDGFLKIDELRFLAPNLNGQPGVQEQTRLVLERGDTVAVLLLNVDSAAVIVVEQIRAGALARGKAGGVLAETPAGVIDPPESPLEAARREVSEETGFRVATLEPICTYFSSPGGSSELVHLFLARVKNEDRIGLGGGNQTEGEAIRVIELPLTEIMRRLDAREIDDAKLIIACQYLRSAGSSVSKPAMPLEHGYIEYLLDKNRKKKLTIITGNIRDVKKSIKVWVNSENTDMMMDRILGRTFSANIRLLGATKYPDGSIDEDLIADDLRRQKRKRGVVDVGDILESKTGELHKRGVKKLLHVATVKARGPGDGLHAELASVTACVDAVLRYAADRSNSWGTRLDNILLPLMGAGDGKLPVVDVAYRTVQACKAFFITNYSRDPSEIYIMAYSSRELEAVQSAINEVGEFYPI